MPWNHVFVALQSLKFTAHQPRPMRVDPKCLSVRQAHAPGYPSKVSTKQEIRWDELGDKGVTTGRIGPAFASKLKPACARRPLAQLDPISTTGVNISALPHLVHRLPSNAKMTGPPPLAAKPPPAGVGPCRLTSYVSFGGVFRAARFASTSPNGLSGDFRHCRGSVPFTSDASFADRSLEPQIDATFPL